MNHRTEREHESEVSAGRTEKILPRRVRIAIDCAAADHETTTREVLKGSQVMNIVAARKQAACTLKRMGLSNGQIGGYLNRDRSSVHAMVADLTPKQIPLSTQSQEIPCPDLSGEWAI